MANPHFFWDIIDDSEPCGCRNVIDQPSGILHRVKTCKEHTLKQRNPESLDKNYYQEIGSLHRDGRHIKSDHMIEMEETIGPFPRCQSGGVALEIGCGVSPYAQAITEAGWMYDGLDASTWVVNWMQGHGYPRTFIGDWMNWEPRFWRGLVLACHVLEHLSDAPAGLSKMAQWVKPGGELRIIVPDDSDKCNPDHRWFFTENTMRMAIERTGLVIEMITSRQIVKKEKFIYVKAKRKY